MRLRWWVRPGGRVRQRRRRRRHRHCPCRRRRRTRSRQPETSPQFGCWAVVLVMKQALTMPAAAALDSQTVAAEWVWLTWPHPLGLLQRRAVRWLRRSQACRVKLCRSPARRCRMTRKLTANWRRPPMGRKCSSGSKKMRGWTAIRGCSPVPQDCRRLGSCLTEQARLGRAALGSIRPLLLSAGLGVALYRPLVWRRAPSCLCLTTERVAQVARQLAGRSVEAVAAARVCGGAEGAVATNQRRPLGSPSWRQAQCSLRLSPRPTPESLTPFRRRRAPEYFGSWQTASGRYLGFR